MQDILSSSRIWVWAESTNVLNIRAVSASCENYLNGKVHTKNYFKFVGREDMVVGSTTVKQAKLYKTKPVGVEALVREVGTPFKLNYRLYEKSTGQQGLT